MRNRTRREAIGTFAAAGAAALFDPRSLVDLSVEQRCGGAAWGRLLGTLPLSRSDGVEQPFGVKLGGPGLDARMVTDLSTLEPDRLITPNALACIRTEAPPGANSFPALARGETTASASRDWLITVSAPGSDPRAVTLRDLTRRARPMGAHLLECSGNNNPANFGLMSVSEYHGVALTDVMARVTPSRAAWGLLVSGMDPNGHSSSNSTAGASWIFPLASLRQLGAFLAVRMNGDPLPLDHGAPVRLVVPGWYACSWIKWVNDLRIVPIAEPATSQMKEFAARTHQARAHDLARDYDPAGIQAAAMPVRVEKRQAGGRVAYRVVGIAWGGTKPIDRLAIRFGAKDRWNTFEVCAPRKTNRTWALWEYHWTPPAPALYEIALRVPVPSVPQRRLDAGYYVRQVRIDEV